VGEYKAKVPCKEYWGNVCSGFGGSLTCRKCGWERHEHDYERYHAKHRADVDPNSEWFDQ
jgi:hypothetical protein